MREKASARDIHGYVDDCLSAEARAAFEICLQEDAELAGNVEAWRSQGDAIRKAFDLEGLAFSVSPSASRAPSRSDPRAQPRGGALVRERFRASVANPSAAADRGKMPRLGRPTLLAAAVLVFLLAGSGATSPWPRDAMRAADVAAFRAFATAAAASLDYQGKEAELFLNTLAPADRHENPSSALVPTGWKLRGVRRAPGALGEAQLALIDRGDAETVGVLVEPLDGPPAAGVDLRSDDGFATASFAQDGFGFVAAARSPAVLTAWLSDLAPAGEAAQTGR